MYCPNCGKENEENAVFCEACGKTLQGEEQTAEEVKKPTRKKGLFIGLGIAAVAIVAVVVTVLVIILNSPKIAGSWSGLDGMVVMTFEKNGDFKMTLTPKTGTEVSIDGEYKISKEEKLILTYKGELSFAGDDEYEWNEEATNSDENYWFIKDDALYLSGEKLDKID